MTRFWAVLCFAALTLMPAPARAQSHADFNSYILKAVDYLTANRARGGYDLHRAFTQNLPYGNETVRMTAAAAGLPGPPYPTMCVAAVAEVIIEALRIYAEETGDRSAYTRLTARSWNSGNIRSIRANLFMFEGTGSRGTGYTLALFGMGEERPFANLEPGDFVNLNRQHSGHAVVFLGYLDAQSRIVDRYSPGVIGFRYFSAQGRGKPDAGFAYRNAYFGPTCPGAAVMPRDCGVIRSTNMRLLNGGRMRAPRAWTTEVAGANLIRSVGARLSRGPHALRGVALDQAIELELERELSPRRDNFFDGETTD